MALSITQEKIGHAYDMLGLLRLVGIDDITEGAYPLCNPKTPRELTWEDYLAAQVAQDNIILTLAGCRRSYRILDIGCGNGTLLERAHEAKMCGTGITISPSQAAYCQSRGLDVHLCDYRNLPPEWQNSFHAVTAKGSIEHFAQPEDAQFGEESMVYRHMFGIVHSLLKDRGYFVTTTIHFREKGQVDPKEILKGPYAHTRYSMEYHFAMILQQVLHGWYPYPGQLEQCASGLFLLEHESDHTHDYHLTSEFWLKIAWRNLLLNPIIWWKVAQLAQKYPADTWDAFRHYLWDQSWMWQFRGDDPPVRLYRQTWEKI